MWFLLLQISALLIIAAAAGAALAWWWLKRRDADTAEARDRIPLTVGHLATLPTREDLEKELASITTFISSQKPVDLLPLEERLSRVQRTVSEMRFPITDLGPVEERLSRLEQKLAAFSIDPVMSRVSDVGAAVAQIKPADLRPLDERLSRLEGVLRDLKPPEVDLGPVHSGIASLGLAVNELGPKMPSLDAITGRIAGLEARLGELGARLEGSRRNDMDTIAARFANITSALANLKMPDMSPVQAKLGEVQGAIASIPRPDLQPVMNSLSGLETLLTMLDKPPVDFGPVHQRLATLDAALQGVRNEVKSATALAPIDRRLAGLEEALGNMPTPDLEPVLGAVNAIDMRNDLVAVENRLTAIEYGLAAVHHMLRSRPDGARNDAARESRNGSAQHGREMPPAPARPAREADPINAVRKPDDQANLLAQPAFGAPDDLELIDGVGPMLRSLLNDIGVYYFWQVAEWTPDEINWVESKLAHFKGRIRRDDWVGHARQLAVAPTAAKRPGPAAARAWGPL